MRRRKITQNEIIWEARPGYVVFRIHKFLDFTIREISGRMFYLYKGQDKIGEFEKFEEINKVVSKLIKLN